MTTILDKTQIKAQLGQWIVTTKQANEVITSLGASVAYHTMKEKSGEFVNELYRIIEKKLPKQAENFKNWMLSVSPISWDKDKKRLKYSEIAYNKLGKDLETIYDYVNQNGFENYKRNILDKPTVTVTQKTIDDKYAALQKLVDKENKAGNKVSMPALQAPAEDDNEQLTGVEYAIALAVELSKIEELTDEEKTLLGKLMARLSVLIDKTTEKAA